MKHCNFVSLPRWVTWREAITGHKKPSHMTSDNNDGQITAQPTPACKSSHITHRPCLSLSGFISFSLIGNISHLFCRLMPRAFFYCHMNVRLMHCSCYKHCIHVGSCKQGVIETKRHKCPSLVFGLSWNNFKYSENCVNDHLAWKTTWSMRPPKFSPLDLVLGSDHPM